MDKKKVSVAAKRFAIGSLIVFNIALVGAVAGAYAMHNYDNGSSNKTAQAIQSALKSVGPVQASAQSK